jgi:CopG family transcriptional regulator/antitoxin EndoAI
VSKGNRSRFIQEAVKHYVATRSRANLRKLLKEGALRNAKRDLEIAEEWFPLDEEAWELHEK